MNSQVLQRFLDGVASETERQQCEAFLNDPDSQVDLSDQAASDRLLETIRIQGDESHDELPAKATKQTWIDKLIGKIEQLVPAQPIGEDDLKRILTPTDDPRAIGNVGRYLVLELLAAGGMGVVFRAEDPELNREVCLKVMNPLLASRPHAKHRFAREAKAASRLQHERVVTVFEVGEHRELPFLAMEMLHGQSLRDRLAQQTSVPADECRRIAIQIAEGLRYAHSCGFLHRDIKPDNIWLTPDGNVKILDFGLALAVDDSIDLTHSGTVLGTPRYMSPEQVQSQSLSESSDLFSLGVVMFEMLTGRTPFERTNVFSTMMSVANDATTDQWKQDQEDLPDPLVQVVNFLLEKDPSKRPQSAEQLIDLLNESATSPLPQATGSPPNRRWPRLLVGLAAGFLLCLFGLVAYQTTDKGTLVIQADPEVEITLKDEKLIVKDPITEKVYHVKVGEQPLPSGVYQLELEDPESEITLAAQVIVIKRGDRELVKVSLESPTLAESTANDKDATNSGGAAEQVAEENNQPEFRISDLKAMGHEELRKSLAIRSDNAISPFSRIRQPIASNETKTWSVESSYPQDVEDAIACLNSNGTRVAIRGSDQFVRIYDDQMNCELILPSPDKVIGIEWSPDPNHILVIYNGFLSQQALIWRLNSSDARVVRRVPIAATQASWNWQGDRIAFKTDSEIRFYDVANDRMFTIPNAPSLKSSLSSKSWSMDRNYFATQERDDLQVWSLSTGQIIHSFNNVNTYAWTSMPKQIVVTRNLEAKAVSELWNVETLVQLKHFDSETEWAPATLAHSTNFQLHAGLKTNGSLSIRDAARVTDIPFLEAAELGTAMEEAENQDTELNSNQVSFSFTGNRLLVQAFRKIGLYERNERGEIRAVTEPIEPALSQLIDTGANGSVQVRGNDVFVASPNVPMHKNGKIDSALVDLRTLSKKEHSHPASSEALDRAMNSSPLYRLAPNKLRFAVWNEADQAIRVFDWSSPEPIRELRGIVASRVEIAWTEDSRYLVIALREDDKGPDEYPRFLRTGDRRVARKSYQISYLCFDMADTSQKSPMNIADNIRSEVVDHDLAIHPDQMIQLHKNRLYLPFEDPSDTTSSGIFTVLEYDLVEKKGVRGIQLGTYLELEQFVIVGEFAICQMRHTFRASPSVGYDLFCISLDSTDEKHEISNRLVHEHPNRPSSTSSLDYTGHTLARLDEETAIYYKDSSTADGWRDGYLITPKQIGDPEFDGQHLTPLRYTNKAMDMPDDIHRTFAFGKDISNIARVSESLAWIDNGESRRQLQLWGNQNTPYRVESVASGWVISTKYGLLAYNDSGTYQGAWFDTRRVDEANAWVPNCWISSEGNIVLGKDARQLWFVGLSGDKIECARLGQGNFPKQLSGVRGHITFAE